MKTTLKTLGFALLILAAGVVSADINVSTSASANVDAGGAMQPPQGQAIKAAIQAVKAEASSTKAEMIQLRGDIKANVEARAENRYTKMLARFQATITRETEIMTKINSRIAKIQATGKDTTEAAGLTASAKVQLDAATSALATLTADANTEAGLESSGSTTAALRLGLAQMRKDGAQIELDLRTAHSDLVKAVVSLLKLVGGATLQASTTVNVHN